MLRNVVFVVGMVGFVVLVSVLTRVSVSGSPFSASEYRFGVKGQWSKMSMSSQEVAGK